MTDRETTLWREEFVRWADKQRDDHATELARRVERIMKGTIQKWCAAHPNYTCYFLDAMGSVTLQVRRVNAEDSNYTLFGWGEGSFSDDRLARVLLPLDNLVHWYNTVQDDYNFNTLEFHVPEQKEVPA